MAATPFFFTSILRDAMLRMAPQDEVALHVLAAVDMDFAPFT